MFLSKFINIPVFIISFLIGLIVVHYSMSSDMRKVYVYPTPENVHILQFKDNVNNCFEFKETEINCPSDESKITHYIPQ
jgi:hypothetical protein